MGCSSKVVGDIFFLLVAAWVYPGRSALQSAEQRLETLCLQQPKGCLTSINYLKKVVGDKKSWATFVIDSVLLIDTFSILFRSCLG